ncbi:hypothetical protein JW906_11840 [bacterium]|nr:hypothetical protein [bacterium]
MSWLVSSEKAQQSWRRILAVWSVLMAGILVQALILHFIMKVPSIADTRPDDRALVNVFRVSLSLLAILDIFLIMMFRKRLFVRTGRERTGMRIPDSETLLSVVLAKYKLWILLCAQMCEGIALAGFVLAFMERNVMAFVPFGVLGMVLIWIYRPQEQEVDELLRKWKGEPS